ncbi:MAG: serine/threonine protein kinase [Alphaproteobacteria bacterium]|nr:serine/threonine protein kinase [Alphaproteobacteria bacterium]
MAQPEVFGQYHLLEKIATGGMAEVFRARSYGMAGFEKILVIKRILEHLSKDREFVALFIDEARIAVSLIHVNIVQVFELGEVSGSYYMAMEYVHGLDLARLVSRARKIGPFPVPLACFIIAEALKALQFAHERTDEDGHPLNIVHCDISPQNILISFSGEVKITDFGISRASFQAKELHEVIRGKYAYMSPEQVEGRKLDGRSDLFSLGIVFYEILTGRRLFKARSRDETLTRVKMAEVPSPRGFRPEISDDLEGFLLRALSRLPEHRFASAAEMLDALSAIVVREGHRATNNDLANYLKSVIEAANARVTATDDDRPRRRSRAGRAMPPSAVVVLAVEATPPPRSIAAPRASLAALTQEWSGVIADRGGEVWESAEGSMLIVWVARGGLRESVSRAVQTAIDLQDITLRSGYRLSAGVAPGVARVHPDTRRPAEGWELAGPFYLARWMMNLSAHRGRVLLTEVGRKQVDRKSKLLGRIPIHGNRYINLYELG